MEFYNCHIEDSAYKNVFDVLNKGYLNQGKYVKLVEEECRKYGVKYPLTCNSCTSALHMALTASNVKGREVILPAKTFIATGMAVLAAGGIPVFCDVNERGVIDRKLVEVKMTNNTAAIIGVSWGGDMSVTSSLYYLKKKHPKIAIIEDAAHSCFAVCTELRNVLDFTCYSFQAIKFINSGDGGLIQCNNEESYKKIRAMRWFGIDKEQMTFSEFGERQYNVDSVGFKYNMNDYNAALLYANFDNLRLRLAKRIEIARRYLRDIRFAKHVQSFTNSTFWLYPMLIEEENRDKFIKNMRARGIPVSKTDTRIDVHNVFGGKQDLPGTESYERCEANLPIHEDMSDNDVQSVINAANEEMMTWL